MMQFVFPYALLILCRSRVLWNGGTQLLSCDGSSSCEFRLLCILNFFETTITILVMPEDRDIQTNLNLTSMCKVVKIALN